MTNGHSKDKVDLDNRKDQFEKLLKDVIGNVTNNTEKPTDSPNDLELDKSPLGSENLQTQKTAEAEKSSASSPIRILDSEEDEMGNTSGLDNNQEMNEKKEVEVTNTPPEIAVAEPKTSKTSEISTLDLQKYLKPQTLHQNSHPNLLYDGQTFQEFLLQTRQYPSKKLQPLPKFTNFDKSQINLSSKLFNLNLTSSLPVILKTHDFCSTVKATKLGILPIIQDDKNLSTSNNKKDNNQISNQLQILLKTKKLVNGIITRPICIRPVDNITYFKELIKKYPFSTFPVVTNDNCFLGIVTFRALEKYDSLKSASSSCLINSDNKTQIQNIMIKKQDLKILELDPAEYLTLTKEKTDRFLVENDVSKLPIVDKASHKLLGMATRFSYRMHQKYKNYLMPDLNSELLVNKNHHLAAGAELDLDFYFNNNQQNNINNQEEESKPTTGGPHPGSTKIILEKIKNLAEAGCDLLYLKGKNPASANFIGILKFTRTNFPNLKILIGDITTLEQAQFFNSHGFTNFMVNDVNLENIYRLRKILGDEAFICAESTEVQEVESEEHKNKNMNYESLYAGANYKMLTYKNEENNTNKHSRRFVDYKSFHYNRTESYEQNSDPLFEDFVVQITSELKEQLLFVGVKNITELYKESHEESIRFSTN